MLFIYLSIYLLIYLINWFILFLYLLFCTIVIIVNYYDSYYLLLSFFFIINIIIPIGSYIYISIYIKKYSTNNSCNVYFSWNYAMLLWNLPRCFAHSTSFRETSWSKIVSENFHKQPQSRMHFVWKDINYVHYEEFPRAFARGRFPRSFGGLSDWSPMPVL